MATLTRTWWGQRFISAVESFTDAGRLSRGRSYATNGRILDWAIEPGRVVATVRGSVNPYFGVYKEPRYKVTIGLGAIAAPTWHTVIGQIGTRASLVTRLLMGEMPEKIELPFEQAGVHLLPHPQARPDTRCTCPDVANPCKHIAGLYYLLARQLDRDPFLMFELRGLSRAALEAELSRTPLGAALAQGLVSEPKPLTPDASLFPSLAYETAPQEVDARAFWQESAYLGQEWGAIAPPSVPALLIKREGDYPAFWPREGSFIEVMEDLYGRSRRTLG